MKAAYYEAFAGEVRLEELADPTPPAHGVVVAVGATGLCRSDWHGWMGHDDDVALPHVPGHEFAGTIAAVGSEVRRHAVGDRVVVPFISGCGTCTFCRAGDEQVCPDQTQPGFTHWGSFAEFTVVHHADHNLVALPEGMDLVTAASLGCRTATAFRAVVDQGRVAPGEWVAVHGCGGVGLSAVQVAVATGARVVAVDVDPAQLDLARSFGAEVVVDARSTEDVPGAVRDVTGGGAHVALDALGHTITCVDAVNGLRRRGRHVQVGLLLGDHATPPLPMGRVVAHELEVLGSHGMQAHRYPALLDLVADGRVDPGALVGETIGLDDLPTALMTLGERRGAGVTVAVLD